LKIFPRRDTNHSRSTPTIAKMRLQFRQASLLLLLPALAVALADSDLASTEAANVPAPRARSDDTVAPVDGKDGKPHNGPFVKTAGKVDESLPALKNRPEDPTVVDGQKIPQSNDGVMDDKSRHPPKEGTTGTEGGVSEREKARKEQDGGATPETPKDHPPLPHSEQEKMKESPNTESGVSSASGFPCLFFTTDVGL
jgi:Ca2+/H+ antiporter, TMEM165/GDT1 family